MDLLLFLLILLILLFGWSGYFVYDRPRYGTELGSLLYILCIVVVVILFVKLLGAI